MPADPDLRPLTARKRAAPEVSPPATTDTAGPAELLARLQADYQALEAKLEYAVWESSTAFNRVHQSKRRLERETARRLILEEELRLASKLEAIGQLAAGVAHEINTPVQYVRDNTAFVAESFGELRSFVDDIGALIKAEESALGSGAEVVEQIKAILEAADLDFVLDEVPAAVEQTQTGLERIAKIVRSMKVLSHPGSSIPSPLDISGAVDSIKTVTTSEWRYVAEFHTVLPEEPCVIECFAGEVNQVLINLIVNAVHAVADRQAAEAEHAGRIEVGVRQEDDRVDIWVTDNGCGVPPEIRQRIFDPFFTTKEVGRGTGQGLSLVHAVVVGKHGGTIGLDSTVGEGTTFTIGLPLTPRVDEPEGSTS
ncbi:MAG: ATP-binding protein [Actinomycetota bacterium]